MTKYLPSRGSLSTHKLPEWYQDAKLGIMIHWGLYSVPAWAEPGDINDLIKTVGHGPHFNHNPYAEWYNNTYLLADSPAKEYHEKKYGKEFMYSSFQEEFESSSRNFDADYWAGLFHEFGAKYVVMITKHHDGYCLWPSDVKNPTTDNYYSKRDFVGELTSSVRNKGMKMGLYYSGVLDWSVLHIPMTSGYTFSRNFQHSQSYIDYATNQYKELIDKYNPSIIWNDIGYPSGYDLNELFSYYYNRVPDGLINDRWTQYNIPKNPLLQPLIKLICWNMDRNTKQVELSKPDRSKFWCDYFTTEYSTHDEIMPYKWEMIRGIGHSFGYNSEEIGSDMLTGKQLIYMLIDTVSKNGNLLINIGPKPDGTIPDSQLQPLRELGDWLKKNGDAIYETRPYQTPMAKTTTNDDIRYTIKDNILNIIILNDVDNEIVIPNFTSTVEELIDTNNISIIRWRQNDNNLYITIDKHVSNPTTIIKAKLSI